MLGIAPAFIHPPITRAAAADVTTANDAGRDQKRSQAQDPNRVQYQDQDPRKQSDGAEFAVARRERLATQFARIADVLDSPDSPYENDDEESDRRRKQAAVALLEQATSLRTHDPDLLRRLIRAAERAGNHVQAASVRRDLLAANPNDVVNQYNVIADRIDALQSIEDRLSVYDRLLSAEAAAIDPTVRSRLGVEAALLHDERGQYAHARDRLEEAAELDPGYAQAARLLVLALERDRASASRRARALVNWARAAPFDPDPMRQLGDLLRNAGAYEASRLALELMRNLLESSGFSVDDETIGSLALLDAAVDDPARGLARLAAHEKRIAEIENRRRSRASPDKDAEATEEIEAGDEGDKVDRTESTGITLEDDAKRSNGARRAETESPRARLPIDLEIARLALADLSGDDDQADASIRNLAQAWADAESEWRNAIEEITDHPQNNEEGAEEADPDDDDDDGDNDPERAAMRAAVRDQLAGIALERLWVRLWLRTTPDDDDPIFDRTLDRDLNELIAMDRIRPEAVQRLRGWTHLRRGEFEQAAELLRPLAGRDLRARLGLALLLTMTDREDAGARDLAEIAARTPGTLIGIQARRRAERLRQRPLPPSETAVQLTEISQSTLIRLRDLIEQPEDRLSLEAEIVGIRGRAAQPHEPIRLRVRLRNASDFPLSLQRGDRRIEPLQVMIAWRASAPGANEDEATATGENDEARSWAPMQPPRTTPAFTLPAGETLTSEIRLDRDATAFLLDQHAAVNLRIAIQIRPRRHLFGLLGQTADDRWRRPRALVVLERAALRSRAAANADRHDDDPNGDDSKITWRKGSPAARLHHLDQLGAMVREPAVVEALGMDTERDDAARDVDRRYLDSQLTQLREAWPHLDPETQAWALLAIPAARRSSTPDRLRAFEQTFDETRWHRLPLTVWLLTRIIEADDPILREALTLDDPLVTPVARYVEAAARRDAPGSK